MADYDAIVVGAGHNGLVCALYLMRAGWRVAVLEANDEIGGGLRSGELTRPGFCHDRYATNLGAFAASPVYQELKADFDAHGVSLLRSDKPYAAVHDRQALRVYTDTERTEAQFAALAASEVAGWRRLTEFYRRIAPNLLPLFYAELAPAAVWPHLTKMLRGGAADITRVARLLLQSSRDFSGEFFQSAAARSLLQAWAYHFDFGPDVRGGAIFGFIAALSSHLNGMPLVQGGAGRIAAALEAMLQAGGAKLITGTEVTRIIVRHGVAVAVRTRSGEEISAARAVIANVTPPRLFRTLLAADDIAGRFLRRIERFRYGPGTFIVHLALERMPRWTAAGDLGGFNYVHLNGSEAEIAASYRHSLQGLLPARPLLVVSQTTPVDPSRAPPGQHVMRIHVRTVPAQITGDAAGTISARNWPHAKAPFAERILDLVEEQAPDLRTCILAAAVESPDEIERENPNFVGGDCVSGSHQLDQNFFCRPLLGWSRYATPVAQLYMIGASTWPGGGVNAGSGYILARKLLRTAGRALPGT
jgi:phytoene dehydrogenase-like protein